MNGNWQTLNLDELKVLRKNIKNYLNNFKENVKRQPITMVNNDGVWEMSQAESNKIKAAHDRVADDLRKVEDRITEKENAG